MEPMTQGMPPQGVQGMPPGRNRLEENRSIYNPTDMTMMVQRGDIKPDMTVRDFFARVGVDVDGPLTQLIEMQKKQVQNAGMEGKMRNIAGQPPGPGQPAPEAPPGPTGLDALMRR